MIRSIWLTACLLWGGSLYAQGFVVLDPSGQSRPVIVVVGDSAYRVLTTPIQGEQPPNQPPPPPTDPGDEPPIVDTFGFKAVAESSTVILNAEQRLTLATVYAALAERASEFANISAMQSALNDALIQSIPDTAPYRPVFAALHLHLTSLWRSKISTPADLAQAYREVAAGARGGLP